MEERILANPDFAVGVYGPLPEYKYLGRASTVDEFFELYEPEWKSQNPLAEEEEWESHKIEVIWNLPIVNK